MYNYVYLPLGAFDFYKLSLGFHYTGGCPLNYIVLKNCIAPFSNHELGRPDVPCGIGR